MQAQAAHKAETTKPDALQLASDPLLPPSRVTSARVGDALVTLGGDSGPIDPTIRLLAQAVVAYSED